MESSAPESSKSHSVAGIGPYSGLIPSQRGSHRSKAQVWAIALSAGVAAGLISWIAGEPVHAFFPPEVFPIRVAFTTYIQPTAASVNTADLKNATLVFTILGAITGLAMGIGGGFAGRSLSRGLVVGLGGLVVGGLVAVLASLRSISPFLSLRRAGPQRFAVADLDPRRYLDGHCCGGRPCVRHWHEVRGALLRCSLRAHASAPSLRH